MDVQFFILFSCHLWFTAAVFHTFSTSLVDQTSRRAQVSGFQHNFFFPALSPVRGRGGGGEGPGLGGGEGREDREEGVTGYYRHPESRTDG